MKKWSNRTRIIALTSMFVLGPFLIGYGQFVVIALTPWFPTLQVLPLGRFFMIVGIIEALLGYILGDAYIAYYRHTHNSFKQPLPQTAIYETRLRRYPLYFGALFCFIIAIISSIIFWF